MYIYIYIKIRTSIFIRSMISTTGSLMSQKLCTVFFFSTQTKNSRNSSDLKLDYFEDSDPPAIRIQNASLGGFKDPQGDTLFFYAKSRKPKFDFTAYGKIQGIFCGILEAFSMDFSGSCKGW